MLFDTAFLRHVEMTYQGNRTLNHVWRLFVKKYTKLFLATLCFISSASVLADGYKGEAPPLVPVTIPNFNGGFEFTLGAIYMQPTSSNLTYFNVRSTSTVTGTPIATFETSNDYAIDPGYDWGFVVGLGYVIPNTANDVRLDWMYFHNDYNDSTLAAGTVGPTSDFDVLFWPSGDDAGSGDMAFNASAKVQYDFDAVDLTFGQYVNIGPRLQTRLFAGLRYMRLNDDLTLNYTEASFDSTTTTSTTQVQSGELNSSFNGLGPLFGVRADYYIGAGFGVSGAFDTALLVGEVSLAGNQTNLTLTDITGTTTTTVSSEDLNWDNNNVVAPGFDAKFGLNYKYQFNNGTLIGLELGYQVTKYIDVVEQLDRGSDVSPDRFDTDVTNFGLNGPYLTLNVKV